MIRTLLSSAHRKKLLGLVLLLCLLAGALLFWQTDAGTPRTTRWSETATSFR